MFKLHVQIISQFMQKCLKTASKAGYKSITFAAIGTGERGYPLEPAIQKMYEAVKEFDKNFTSKTTLSVHFIVHPNNVIKLTVSVFWHFYLVIKKILKDV